MSRTRKRGDFVDLRPLGPADPQELTLHALLYRAQTADASQADLFLRLPKEVRIQLLVELPLADVERFCRASAALRLALCGVGRTLVRDVRREQSVIYLSEVWARKLERDFGTSTVVERCRAPTYAERRAVALALRTYVSRPFGAREITRRLAELYRALMTKAFFADAGRPSPWSDRRFVRHTPGQAVVYYVDLDTSEHQVTFTSVPLVTLYQQDLIGATDARTLTERDHVQIRVPLPADVTATNGAEKLESGALLALVLVSDTDGVVVSSDGRQTLVIDSVFRARRDAVPPRGLLGEALDFAKLRTTNDGRATTVELRIDNGAPAAAFQPERKSFQSVELYAVEPIGDDAGARLRLLQAVDNVALANAYKERIEPLLLTETHYVFVYDSRAAHHHTLVVVPLADRGAQPLGYGRNDRRLDLELDVRLGELDVAWKAFATAPRADGAFRIVAHREQTRSWPGSIYPDQRTTDVVVIAIGADGVAAVATVHRLLTYVQVTPDPFDADVSVTGGEDIALMANRYLVGAFRVFTHDYEGDTKSDEDVDVYLDIITGRLVLAGWSATGSRTLAADLSNARPPSIDVRELLFGGRERIDGARIVLWRPPGVDE